MPARGTLGVAATLFILLIAVEGTLLLIPVRLR
jgi:hypothetical protein